MDKQALKVIQKSTILEQNVTLVPISSKLKKGTK